jgi:hypothetical protein
MELPVLFLYPRRRIPGGFTMKRTHYLFGIGAIALLMLLSSMACATTIVAQGGTIPTVGDQKQFGITGDSFPNGLLGYEFDVTLTAPANAEIVSFQFPAWVLITSNSTVPTDTLHVKAAGNFAVPVGSTNVPLVTVTVRGDMAGLTGLTVTNVARLEDYNGENIPYSVVPGTINVGGVPTSTATTTVTTTIPTSTATTTVTTTIPTSTATTTVTTTIPTSTATTTVTTTIPTTTDTETTPVPAGSITVFTQNGVKGASVTLNGDVIGETQLIEKTVPAGTYTLSVSLAGYNTYIETVTIYPDQRTTIFFNMQKGNGTVIPSPPTTSTTAMTTSTTTMATMTPTPSVSPSPSPTDGNSSFLSGISNALNYWRQILSHNTINDFLQKYR